MSLVGTVLVVDDDPDVLRTFADVLRKEDGLHVLVAPDAEQGLDAARIHRPDLILSDYSMPGLDGAAFCRAVRADPNLAGTLFVVITGVPNAHGEIDRTSGIDDLIAKPVSAGELVGKVAAMLRLKRAYDELRADKLELERLHEAMGQRFEQLLSLLVHLVDLSVPGAAARGAETARLAARLAERFEVPSVLLRDLEVAARLHEIGRVLHRPEPGGGEGPEDVIEGDEWRYAVAAKELFERTEGLENAAELIGGIFENWDGTGHPDRLRQGQIPLRSRILRILIDYQGLLQSGAAATPVAAVEQLHHYAGTRYDPLAVAYFDAIIRASAETDWVETRTRVPVAELQEGMVLADDLFTSSGVKLLAKGATISAGALEVILRRHRSDPIVHGAWIARNR